MHAERQRAYALGRESEHAGMMVLTITNACGHLPMRN